MLRLVGAKRIAAVRSATVSAEGVPEVEQVEQVEQVVGVERIVAADQSERATEQ